MPNFFERRDVFGNSPAVWILAAILFAVPFGSWSLSQLQRHDDASAGLFPTDAVRQTHEWAAETFPLQQDLLVTWKGSSLHDPRVAEFRRCLEPQRDAKGVLRGGIPQIARVDDPQDALQRMLAGEVSAGDAIQRLTGIGVGPGPLCVRLTEEGRKRQRRIVSELPVTAKKQWGIELSVMTPAEFEQHSAPEGAIEPVVLSADGILQENADTTHELCIVARKISDRELVDRLQTFELEGVTGDASLIADLFYLPGRPIALNMTFTDAGRADRAGTLNRIRTTAAEIGIPTSDLHLIGPAVIEDDLRAVTQRAAWNPLAPWQQVSRRSALLTSVIAGVLLTVLLLRDVRLVLICLSCAGGTVFFTLALMRVVGADLTAWQYTTPVWLGAFALAAAIHLARQSQIVGPVAMRDVISQSGGVIIAAAGLLLVSVIGWSASPLVSVRDWGEVASVALLAALTLILLGVPSLMLLWPAKTPAMPQDSALWHTIGGWWTNRPAWQSLGVALVITAAAWGLRQTNLELDILHGLPATSSARQAITEIESQLVGSILAESIIRFDTRAQDERDALTRMELVREVAAQLRIHPAVSGCTSWADFFPVTEELSDDASRLETTRRAKLADARQEAWRDSAADPHAAKFYTVAMKDRDAILDGDRGYCQKGDELWRISTRVRWSGSTGLAQTQRELDATIRSVLKAAPGTKHHLIGPLALQVQTERLMLRSFLIAMGAAAGIIVLLSIVALRHFGAALLVLLPTAAPIAAVLGGASWLNQPLDPMTMFAASLAMGLSAGHMLPMLIAFQRARSGGQTRADAVRTMLAECGPSVCRSAWIIGLTVLPLSTSDGWVIGHLGRMLPLMVAVGAIAQVMWLPQLLAGPVGLIFAQGPTLKRGQSARDDTAMVHPRAA